VAPEGRTPQDIQIVEMAPPDMPAAIYANRSGTRNGTGEPFGAAAQRAGTRAPCRTADECATIFAVVTSRRTHRQSRPLVKICRPCLARAEWPRRQTGEPQTKAEAIAAGRNFHSGPQHLQFVQDNPTDGDLWHLRMIRRNSDETDCGCRSKPGPSAEIHGRTDVDESFARLD